jgi:hypothetical protein
MNKFLFLFALPASLFVTLGQAGISAQPAKSAAGISVAQKTAARALIRELVAVENNTGQGMYLPLYETQVGKLSSSASTYLDKLPEGRLKRYLQTAVGTHVDVLTVITECNKYRYYDLIKNRRTPKIIQKYHLPYSLQSNQPYQELDAGTVSSIETMMWAIAAAARARAQQSLN